MSYDDVPIMEDPQEPRCACVLLLDVSGSMAGNPINELNRGLKILCQSLNDDALARKRVEVAIVTFGDVGRLHTDFTLAPDWRPEDLQIDGATGMGSAIRTGLQTLDERYRVYKANGNRPYKPWVFLLTDGAPTDFGKGSAANHQIAQEIKAGQQAGKFLFFPIGVEGADFDLLNSLSSTPAMKLKGVNFRELFQWISQSMKAVSGSRPDDKLKLPSTGSWGEVEV